MKNEKTTEEPNTAGQLAKAGKPVATSSGRLAGHCPLDCFPPVRLLQEEPHSGCAFWSLQSHA